MPAAELQDAVVAAAQTWSPPGGEALARLLSILGGEYLYLLLIPGLLWLAPWQMAVRAARGMVLADLVGEYIKWSLMWPRPGLSLALVNEPSPGFVSTHASISMAVALLVGAEKRQLRPWLALWVAGVGWSRLRLGVHFPLDIVGGWAVGAVVAALLWRLGGDTRRSSAATLLTAFVLAAAWPQSGGESLQRDLGMLLGLELGLLLRHRGGPHPPPGPLSPGQASSRFLLLLLGYVGFKAMGWPRLARYAVLALLASWRSTPQGFTLEISEKNRERANFPPDPPV